MKYLFLLVTVILIGCQKPSQPISNSGPRVMKPSPNTTCELIEKEFYKKNGVGTGIKELYLRCSIQDYFIKLCESDVTAKDLKPYLNKGITVEMEVIDGNWDICPDDPQEMQSRVGTYIIIKKIIE